MLLPLTEKNELRVVGTLYVITAASGTGKTSMARALSLSMPNIKISISHTTRPIRVGEQENVHYLYVKEDVFLEMIAHGMFLEYAKVFDYYYGTSRSFVTEQLQAGQDVILNIDWQGARQIKQKMSSCVTVFLLPPSKLALRQRLEGRDSDAQEVIEKRLAVAGSEIIHCDEFDYLIINDDFATALQDLQAIIRTHRLQQNVQVLKYSPLIKELLS